MGKKASQLPLLARDYKRATIPGTDVSMLGLAEPHPLAPKQRPFRFNEEQVAEVAMAVKLGMNTMLTGPSGCGKTELVLQMAAHLGLPCVRFNCHGETRVSQLVGQQRPAAVDGVLTLLFNPGDLVIAAREGYWVLVDEIDMASPHVLGVLHPLLEEGSRMMHVPETAETVYAHDDFHFFATGNTIGYRSQHRARFAGTGSLNSALLGRFGVVIACDYPEEAEEIERIACHVPDLDMVYVKAVARVAKKLREDPNFKSDLSTRSLIQWARIIEARGDDFRSFELAILRKIENPIDAKVARACVVELFGYTDTSKDKGR